MRLQVQAIRRLQSIGAAGAAAALALALGSSDAVAGNLRAFPVSDSGLVHMKIDGAESNNQIGLSSANAGDVNGDGIDDMLLASRNATLPGRPSSGVIYLIYGSRSGSVSNLATLTPSQGYRIDGPEGSAQAGESVANAGDVNGDNVPDQLIGAFGQSLDGSTVGGVVHVVYGRRAGTSLPPPAAGSNEIDLNPAGTNGMQPGDGYRIRGTSFSFCGSSVSSAGDVDGDGIPDALIGCKNRTDVAPGDGSAYVIYGRRAGTSRDVPQPATPAKNYIDLDPAGTGGAGSISPFTTDSGYRIDSAAPGFSDGLGTSVAPAGDVNGDGVADHIIGGPEADGHGQTGNGALFVVYGRRAGTVLAPPTSNTNNYVSLYPDAGAAAGAIAPFTQGSGYRIDGTGGGGFGQTVDGAGDVDGDGVPDLVAGEYLARGRGSAYVIYGRRSGLRQPPAANDSLWAGAGANGPEPDLGYEFRGPNTDSWTGRSVANAGDVNGDGVPDQVVGAANANVGTTQKAGIGYVVYGRRSGDLSPPETAEPISLDPDAATNPLTGSDGYRVDGSGLDDELGYAATGVGDQNGDGRPDQLFSAPYATPNGAASGSNYVITVKPISVTTLAAESVVPTSAKLVGRINPGGVRADYKFQVGSTPSFGATSTAVSVDGYDSQTVTLPTTNLLPCSTYYYRIFATNRLDQTEVGATSTFTTPKNSEGRCDVQPPCKGFKAGGKCGRSGIRVSMGGSNKRFGGKLDLVVGSGGVPLASVRVVVPRTAGLPSSRATVKKLRGSLSLQAGTKSKPTTVRLKRTRKRGRKLLATYSGGANARIRLIKNRRSDLIEISALPRGADTLTLRLRGIRGAYVAGRKRCVVNKFDTTLFDLFKVPDPLRANVKICRLAAR